MCKELEAFERIDSTLYFNNIKGKLEFGIDTEEHTDCDSVIGMVDDLETIEQALKEKIVWKNIHNTKVKIPLCNIVNGMNQQERFRTIEHIYYHWEEMKEALEDKNKELEKENARNEEILQKYYHEGITLDSVRALKQENAEYKRVLAIIFGKKVDIVYLNDSNNVEEYNSHFGCVVCKLTSEEFNLLKRYFGNEHTPSK